MRETLCLDTVLFNRVRRSLDLKWCGDPLVPIMVEHVGAEIVVRPDAPFSTPLRRSTTGRLVRATTKVRDAALQLENTTEGVEKPKRSTRTATRAAPIDDETDRSTEKRGSGSNDGRAMLQKMLGILGELQLELRGLRQEVRDQRDIIEEQQGMIRTLGRQLEDTKNQVGEDLKQHHEQLEAIATRITESQPRSYAEAARAQPRSTSQPNSIGASLNQGKTPSSFADSIHCTIDTSRNNNERADEITPGIIRALVEGEVRTEQGRPGWRCLAVIQDPKKPRIRIACRNEDEYKTIKRLIEDKLPRGARMLQDQYYQVKVDGVKRTVILDEGNNIRAEAADEIGRENEIQIAKVGWLSKRETYKAYGSMVLYLTSASDARRLLEDGYAYAGGESGRTAVFEHRDRPEQCYNCQQVGDGHKAYQCNNAQVCGKCAKEGHNHRDCLEAISKCVLCEGPHPSFSRNCRRLYPSPNE